MANRDDMLSFAELALSRIGGACDKAEIAGGLRRGKPDPHDIELVVIPKFDHDLLGEQTEGTGELDAAIALMVREGLIEWDEVVKRRGLKYRRFTVPSVEGVPFELFCAVKENWGNQLCIRTGPADWNKLMVTSGRWGGCMPPNMIHASGFLWRFPDVFMAAAAAKMKAKGSSYFKDYLKKAERLDALTEEEFFRHLRLPYVEPERRTQERAAELAVLAARGGLRAEAVAS